LRAKRRRLARAAWRSSAGHRTTFGGGMGRGGGPVAAAVMVAEQRTARDGERGMAAGL
jgi:hypothetical protein